MPAAPGERQPTSDSGTEAHNNIVVVEKRLDATCVVRCRCLIRARLYTFCGLFDYDDPLGLGQFVRVCSQAGLEELGGGEVCSVRIEPPTRQPQILQQLTSSIASAAASALTQCSRATPRSAGKLTIRL
jgi:hypothetical protein